MMFQYRTKRVHLEGHYKWAIQASPNGEQWTILTNMEGLVPLYHSERAAQEVAEALRQMENGEPGSETQCMLIQS